jgi:hypothetical protein
VKRAFLVIGSIVGLVAIWSLVIRVLPSYMDYRGEKIKLTKYYLAYDSYKNDPDNIDLPKQHESNSSSARRRSLVLSTAEKR